MLPALLNFLWLLVQAFTAFSLLVPALLCLFCIARHKRAGLPQDDEELHEEKDYAIIISAQEPSGNLYGLLQSLAQLDYTNYIVYVASNHTSAADTCLYNDKVMYLRTTRPFEPHFLHRFVIENFKRPHTHIAILDSDSRVDKHFLTGLNTFFNQGYQAVVCPQIHRNKTGMGNFLQSVICRYHNFFTGRLLFLSGSSAKLSSTGAAFTIHGYKQCLKTKINNTGSASMMQAMLIRRNHQIAFADGAVVYKDSHTDMRQVAAQHAQRVHDWLTGLWCSCNIIAGGIRTWNANRFLSGLTSLRMPVSTALFIGLACLAVNAKIHSSVVSLWVIALLSLPVYVIIATTQSSGSNPYSDIKMGDEENIHESIVLYEEGGYEPAMQTV